LIIFVLFIILMCLGIPIAFALLVPSVLAFVFYPELTIQLMDARVANSFLSSTLLAIPLFVFAAQILTDIKIADAIFGFVNKCVGHIRGGLAHVNVIASVVFAGMSGSAVADAAGLGKVEIKAMTDEGYPPALAGAITAASATIGPIIPPSIAAIVYGSLAEVSIGKLLIGGFIPGVVMAIMLMIGIALIARQRGLPKRRFVGVKQIGISFVKAFPGLMAPLILIGGMLFGFFTPTEAATMAVVYAIVVGFLLKALTFEGLWESFKQASLDGAIIMFMFIASSLIGLLVTRLNMGDAAIRFMSGLTNSPKVLLLILNIFLLIIGCLLDATCSQFLLTPILVPLVKAYGIDPIHFGIVMILNLMIGLCTPPMGALLFITGKIAEVSITELLKEIWPFLIWLLIALLIVTYVPQTVLWLPNLFMK
jgi:tripartite ATP-independent transporter DctM subunit